MKSIGERISIKSSAEQATIVISSTIASWKEALMAAWLVCWLICLGFFFAETFKPQPNQQLIILFVIIVFMIYYALRIGKAFAWRRVGMEYIKLTDEALTYKRSIRKFGKAHVFYLENIQDLAIVTKEDGSITKALENSFWVLGGERISFKYFDRTIRIGIQLSDNDAEEFAKWLNQRIKKRLRNKQQAEQQLGEVEPSS